MPLSKVVSYSSKIQIEDHLPLIVLFRKEWQSLTPGFMWNLEKEVRARIYPCETFADLSTILVQNPKLIIMDIDCLSHKDVNPHEILNAVQTLYRISDTNDKLAIAVSIGPLCCQEKIRAIQKTEISGLVPILTDGGLTDTGIAIRELLKNNKYWPKITFNDPRHEGVKIEQGVATPAPAINAKLTDRQKQVLDLIYRRGLSNKSIANMLSISESTVKIHVGAIMKAYGVRNRTQLALAAGEKFKA